jgi:hypothetical protein
MQIKLSVRQWTVSTLVFGGMLVALATVDERVRDKVGGVLSGADSLTPFGDRITDVGSVIVTAIRHQSIDNAPLMIFAVVGFVLFVFMVRA